MLKWEYKSLTYKGGKRATLIRYLTKILVNAVFSDENVNGD